MFKHPSSSSRNRRESCFFGCLCTCVAGAGLWLIFGFLNQTRYVQHRPTETALLGRWHVTEVADSVSHWMANGSQTVRNGTHVSEAANSDSMDARRHPMHLDPGWIEFHADGRATAHVLPWVLEGEACYRVSDEGHWELKDTRSDHSRVQWQIQVDLHGTIHNLNLFKDGEHICLDIPIDWELSPSVSLRKEMP